MEADIKCLECGKGTRNFELGEVFYCRENPTSNTLIKNEVICPKCKASISNEKFLVKENYFYMGIITANLCIASKMSIPEHLRGAKLINEKDYDKFSSYCKSKPKFVNKF
ncbi:hypothetical protein HYU23_00825 [Candidatus Woesearchaeota archaeon]|nr:hypothetical protein [Candidatus Woesearchaeota archaeon]